MAPTACPTGLSRQPQQPHHMAGPKDMTMGKERVKDRKQTLLSVSVCQELCLAAGAGQQTLICVPSPSPDKSLGGWVAVITFILNEKGRLQETKSWSPPS